MHHHHGRPNGLWHIGMWLAAAGFAAPVLAASAGESPGASEAAASDATVLSVERVASSQAAALSDFPQDGQLAWDSVDDSTLDSARGGFTTDKGLTVSLGIERVVAINGDVVGRSRIDIADLSRLSGEQARQTSEALSSVKLIQNGSANIYRPGESSATMAAMVIQNSLNNQLIRTDTVISSTVNSAGLLSTLNFHGTLQDALVHATGQQ